MPMGDLELPAPVTLDSAWLKILVSQRDSLLVGNAARVPLNYHLWLPPVCFELMPKDRQERTEFFILAGDLNNPEYRGMLLYHGGKEEYV